MSHATQGQPRWIGQSGEFWQNIIHWRRERQTTPVHLQWGPHELYKKAKRYETERWAPRLGGVRYATGEVWRTTSNSPRKNETAGPKRKWLSVVDVSGVESKISHCKELWCIGTWNVRSMNQGKLDAVKQEMARLTICILGICELKRTRMGEFNSDDIYCVLKMS